MPPTLTLQQRINQLNQILIVEPVHRAAAALQDHARRRWSELVHEMGFAEQLCSNPPDDPAILRDFKLRLVTAAPATVEIEDVRSRDYDLRQGVSQVLADLSRQVVLVWARHDLPEGWRLLDVQLSFERDFYQCHFGARTWVLIPMDKSDG